MAQNTFSWLLEMVKLKGFISTATSLTDLQLLALANDSYRSYIVPFCKGLRDEWQIGKDDYVANTDPNSRIALPDSVASTLRTIAWNNNGVFIPLTRIEPENQYLYQPNSASSIPIGFMLRGYELVILPRQPTAFPIYISYMKRPPRGVLESDAAEITVVAGPVLTLAEVPLAWQSEAPTSVSIVNADSPFTPVVETVAVVSLVSDQLTLASSTGAEVGRWVSDVGTSPFPNLPIELMPLLELDVLNVLYRAVGDKRLKDSLMAQKGPKLDGVGGMEGELRLLMSPRAQGNTRPIINYTAPGWNTGGWMGWGGRRGF